MILSDINRNTTETKVKNKIVYRLLMWYLLQNKEICCIFESFYEQKP